MRKTALLAVLLLAGCSSSSSGTGSATTAGSPDAQTVTVEMHNDLKFHPSTVKARVGTVTFDVRNTETVPHDLVFRDEGLGKTRTIDGKSDTTLTVTFDKAGTFRFVCSIHPRMDGQVVVS